MNDTKSFRQYWLEFWHGITRPSLAALVITFSFGLCHDQHRLARMDCQGQPSEGLGSQPLKPLNCLLTLGPYLSHFR